MKTEPVIPARIVFDRGPPSAPDFDDLYHPRAGALEQARHVFLGGNRLPERWQGRESFVVLETGFGLGNNFVATWAVWRGNPRRCERLTYISIEKHPPTRDDLARAHAHSALPGLAHQLVAAWPPLTPSLHRLAFDRGRVTLLLALGDVATWLPEIVAEVDAFFLDGFAPARNPAMWDRRVLKAVGRLAASGSTAATWSVARDVREGLATSGFIVETAPGFGDKREMTVARFAPAFTPRRAPARTIGRRGSDVLVVGAGLAGASAARALADEGIDTLVLDAQALPALGSSGNAAGLFHGTVHADDGPHARFNRAAALAATSTLRPLIGQGLLPGQCDGLLRLDGGEVSANWLPADYVQRLDAAQARERCGWPLGAGAWFYPGGGWLDPSALVRQGLQHERIRFRGGIHVQSLREAGARWQALDAGGTLIAEAAHVVLANAHDAPRLLGHPAWPLESLRGQLTRVPAGVLAPPRIPVAGAGYAIGLPDGGLLCGATSQRDDADATLREQDHRHNLERLERLAGPLPPIDMHTLDGRVGWRLSAVDRLPLIGAVPAAAAQGTRLDQPRFVPRMPGLFVFAALGSRGIAWSTLGAQALASWITGAPFPLEASLVDAIDPARFVSRRVRRPSA